MVRRVSNAEMIAERDDLSPDDKRRMLAIDSALDEDDLEALLKALPDAAASTNAEVRSDLVDALGWFGKKAMLDLMPFMADADEDVRQSAIDNWNMALSDINSEKQKCSYIESAMTVLTDEDALDTMITELMDCDDRLAVQTIVNIISSGTKEAVKAAKEQYEFQTGEEYTTIEAAETWLQENYLDHDDDDDDGTATTATTSSKTTSRKSSRSRSSGTTATGGGDGDGDGGEGEGEESAVDENIEDLSDDTPTGEDEEEMEAGLDGEEEEEPDAAGQGENAPPAPVLVQ